MDLSDRLDNSLGNQQFEGMAAMAGQGVALVNPFFFAADLAAGRLVQIFDLVAKADRSYFVVYPKARRRSPKIRAFCDWILGEAERDSAQAALNEECRRSRSAFQLHRRVALPAAAPNRRWPSLFDFASALRDRAPVAAPPRRGFASEPSMTSLAVTERMSPRRARRPFSPSTAALRARLVEFVGASHARLCAALVLISLACFLPGFASLQPMDRDEPRYAQASKQMLETGDFVDIRFQDEARHKKPVGIYWMQSAAVALGDALGVPEARTTIALYRLPSLFGALATVLLTYWAALAFLEPARRLPGGGA